MVTSWVYTGCFNKFNHISIVHCGLDYNSRCTVRATAFCIHWLWIAAASNCLKVLDFQPSPLHVWYRLSLVWWLSKVFLPPCRVVLPVFPTAVAWPGHDGLLIFLAVVVGVDFAAVIVCPTGVVEVGFATELRNLFGYGSYDLLLQFCEFLMLLLLVCFGTYGS